MEYLTKMPTQKFCNATGCKKFIFVTMDELAEHGWGAFQIPAGKGKPLCFCPEHQIEMREQMEKKLTKLSEEGRHGIPPKPKVLGILPNFI